MAFEFLKNFPDTKREAMNFVDVGFTRENSSILQIPSVSYEDAGFYECIADNGIQPSLKSNFSITIRGKKIILFLVEQNVYILKNSTKIILLCNKILPWKIYFVSLS